MEFLKRAVYPVIGLSCACCDSPIEPGQAVYFDVDGERDADGQNRTSITALHGWCFDYAQRLLANERAQALIDAAQCVRASGSLGSAYECLMVKARSARARVLEMVA